MAAEDTDGVQGKARSKKQKKEKGGKKQEMPQSDIAEATVASDEVDGEVEEDDQTAALLAGFESDDDENDPDEDKDFADDAAVPALSKKQRTELEQAAKGPKSNEPGVVYVGRIPRGFFEPQMKKYFSQFGRVLRLRLSRNKTTGASKHYAFVEFASTEVADIVARTMDNYLLFGHILKCKFIPSEQVQPDLFKGAGQRFKVDPRNKKAGLEMERGVERAQWEKRVERENKRRTGKRKHVKETLGYEFEALKVKSVDDVPKQTAALENEESLEQLTGAPTPAEEAPAEVEDCPIKEQPKPKKGKKAARANGEAPAERKSKRGAKVAHDVTVQPEAVAEAVETPAPEKKSKKAKKRKSDVAIDSATPAEEAPAASTSKGKKFKEPKSTTVTEDAPEKKRKAKAETDVTRPKKAKKAKV